MGAGAIATVDGRVESQSPACQFTITFDGVPPGDLAGPYPDMVVDFVLAAQAGTGSGTITFDGTNAARIRITLGGAGPFVFLINLDTGALTVAP
ncbi:MAG: hypothetical protein HC813_00920 [Planctomycetes bacterium]|nr:hypothetical protein [Planctomycetota bacterium]